jgi:hypothetical protein
MDMEIRASLAVQHASGANPAAASPNANPLSRADVQKIRDQALQAARKAIAAEGLQEGTPLPPDVPRTVTIRGPDGSQTVVTVPHYDADKVIPPQVEDISIAFFITIAIIIIGLPVARAFARRMDRRATSAVIPQELSTQLTQLNHAVDAIALEVERISEGQRFAARLLSEQRDASRPTVPTTTNR